MILGFKKQFVEKINNGTKIHTIRQDKHNRWEEGREIQMATGVRTSDYNQFNEGVCKSIQTIEFKWNYDNSRKFGGNSGRTVRVFIDGVDITNHNEMIDALVKNDGFESREELFTWFKSNFRGKLIHWTNFKYEVPCN